MTRRRGRSNSSSGSSSGGSSSSDGVDDSEWGSTISLACLPPSPPLYHPPTSRFRILGYAVRFSDLEEWADKRRIAVGQPLHIRHQLAWKAIRRRVPPECRQIAAVSLRRALSPCLIITSNRSAETLQRALDVDLIERVRAVLGWLEPPVWYSPVDL